MGQFCSDEYWCWGVFESIFLLDSYITLVGRQWRNRKGTYAQLAFIITEIVLKLLVLWQTIGEDITYRVSPNKLLGEMPPCPPVSAPMRHGRLVGDLSTRVCLASERRCFRDAVYMHAKQWLRNRLCRNTVDTVHLIYIVVYWGSTKDSMRNHSLYFVLPSSCILSQLIPKNFKKVIGLGLGLDH